MLCHLSTDEKYPDTKLLNQYHLYFPQIENHIQIVYLINPPWYDHFKLILRILESNYKLMSYTVDCRFTCTSKGVNSFCTRVPLTNYSGCAE